jgi:adenylate cyclase
MDGSPVPLRRSLFRKYFTVLFVAVVVPLLVKSITDAWFGYGDQRTLLNALLRVEAASGASRIRSFLDGIREQLGWTLQRPWTAGSEEQHRLDSMRVLRQAPAIVDIALVDDAGIERLSVSRIDLNSAGSGVDRSADAVVRAARAAGAWYGPVSYRGGSEPFMTIAMAGNRNAVGIAVAEVNLKLIWEVISSIGVGRTGHAYVLNQDGRLVAHPDISRVLRGEDDDTSAVTRRLRGEVVAARGEAITTKGLDGKTVVAATAPIAGVDWVLVVEQPLSEAFAPIRRSLWRAGGLLLCGAAASGALAFWLARRMTGPIRRLEEGTERIGAGHFDHRIQIATGDELERLANEFNRMAGELALSQERSERIARLKRFLAPQVAELVERSGDESLLAGHLTDVVVVFCDLRGFTAFAASADPKEIMGLLSDYYAALGSIITSYGATLTSFQGDGLMVLVNAPVPCEEPAQHGVQMAIEMQAAVRHVIRGWRSCGHPIGFGVGIAAGPATVGQIGYEGRVDYTAIGDAVNLASRLCATAEDGQILLNAAVADAVRGEIRLAALGERRLKGYDRQLIVHSVEGEVVPRRAVEVITNP